jgi:hypothetical protein
MEGMTMPYTGDYKRRAFYKTMYFKRFEGVMGTARVEPTLGTKPRA